MAVLIAHASLGEGGQTRGGKAGDQTGNEVCIRSWYSKPWGFVIRFTDPIMREKLAKCMENAAANNHIGYDQNQRNTLLKYARKYNYDVSRVTDDCECDCSSLVSVACMYAGIPESALTLNGNCATTRTLRPILKSTGEVDIHSTTMYTGKPDRLIRGDILLKEGSHIAVVVQGNEEQKSLEQIAKEVIAGVWGNGIERKQKLRAAGYNPAMVQAKVNEILSSKKN